MNISDSIETNLRRYHTERTVFLKRLKNLSGYTDLKIFLFGSSK